MTVREKRYLTTQMLNFTGRAIVTELVSDCFKDFSIFANERATQK